MNNTQGQWIFIRHEEVSGFVREKEEGVFDVVQVETLNSHIYTARYDNLKLDEMNTDDFVSREACETYLQLKTKEEQILFWAIEGVVGDDFSQFSDVYELSEELRKEGILTSHQFPHQDLATA